MSGHRIEVVDHPELVVMHEADGSHDIYAVAHESLWLIVTVRPVGNLQPGPIMGAWTAISPKWVPQIVAALSIAEKIAGREKPWEAYRPEVAA